MSSDKIEVIPFDRFGHLLSVGNWLIDRGLTSELSHDLPAIGFVACQGPALLAAAFLRRCEGECGIFDSLITNPEAPIMTRKHAIDALVEKILRVARELGFRRVLTFSSNKSTIMRATRHGFRKTPFHVATLDLTQGGVGDEFSREHVREL